MAATRIAMPEAPGSGTAPFSGARRGFVLGEGAYALWMEPADRAVARGARVRAEVLGIGASSTSVGLNAWPECSGPIVRNIRLALCDAGLRPEDVDVVYAAVNASPALDAVEGEALTRLFGGMRTVVTSLKGAIGECGASAAASCVAAVLCGSTGCVPPVAGLSDIDPAFASLRIPREPIPAPGPIVLVNSIGSGGALFAAVLRIDHPG